MVLVSHKYRFIYIKNLKVAGTSVETYFGQYCIPPDEKYNISEKTNEYINDYGIIGARTLKQSNYTEWYNHITASKIKELLKPNIFNNYMKFCIVRNPWDVAVSKYYWRKTKKTFYNYIIDLDKTNFKGFKKNWDIYTIENKPICDFYIKFENLHNDINSLCLQLGISDFSIDKLPNYKSNIRPKDNYRDYYNTQTKNIIYKHFQSEIEYFNYIF